MKYRTYRSLPDYRLDPPVRRVNECPACGADLEARYGGEEAECTECDWDSGPAEDPNDDRI